MMKTQAYVSIALASIMGTVSLGVHANSPWGAEVGTYQLSYSRVHDSFDQKFLGTEDATDIAEISQSTDWINFATGLTDTISLAVQMGYTSSEWDMNDITYHGLADSVVAVQWEQINQFAHDRLATVAWRMAAVIAGNYQRSSGGRPHGPGDKANGFDSSVLMGRFVTDQFSAQGEFGYRLRLNDVPDEVFFNLGMNFSVTQHWGASLNWATKVAVEGGDINDSDFKGEFHKTREDRSTIDANVGLNINGISGALGVARQIDVGGIGGARNTGKSTVVHLSMGYAF
ncbi:MAG: hypothetical protein COB04_12900 [Gammaproteobacteria bacterium]|nr:MAG: hypothetical protein COB04_12900 [Gammaproteobacteria bacterium]